MKRLIPLCLLLSVSACGDAADSVPAGEARLSLGTFQVVRQSVPGVFEAGGVVRAHATAAIASRILAPVVAVLVSPGDRVQPGQRLIVLDGREHEANTRRASAAVVAAEKAVTVAEADRDGARATAALAQAAHQRIATLHAQRSATPQELDEAVAAVGTANARNGAADARVEEAAAALMAAREGLAAAHIASSFTVLTAPFAGIVSDTLIDAGSLASPGVPLLTLDDARPFEVEVNLDESRAAHLELGDPVDVVVAALDGDGSRQTRSTWRGRIREMSRAMNEGSHSFLVKIELPSIVSGLRSGMFARALFQDAPREILAVPRDAVISRGQLSTVFVATNGRARLRVVSLGELNGDFYEVLAGLVEHEIVVRRPPPSLHDGEPVTGAAASGARHD